MFNCHPLPLQMVIEMDEEAQGLSGVLVYTHLYHVVPDLLCLLLTSRLQPVRTYSVHIMLAMSRYIWQGGAAGCARQRLRVRTVPLHSTGAFASRTLLLLTHRNTRTVFFL